MEPSYKNRKKNSISRESIIGLGESSVRKNYYPELQEKLLALEHINSRNRALISAMPDILLVCGNNGRIMPFSQMGTQNSELVMVILGNQDIIQLLRTIVNEVLEQRNLMTSIFTLDHKSTAYTFEARLHMTELDEVLIVIRDISEQVALENQLRAAAEQDALTLLKNRAYFESYVEHYDGLPRENFAIILLDIDGLKLINDTYGHIAGDNLICDMAALIDASFGQIALIARISGDEFGVVIEGYPIEEIEDHLETLSDSVKYYNESTDKIEVTLSFGYAYHKQGQVDIKGLYQVADNNMYQNKLLKTSSTRHNTVKTLMKTLEVRDYITEGHADRMGENAIALGKKLKLPQHELNKLELLAKFHDIGKVGISDTILNKPAKLTDDEYEIMKTHSAIGERIANESSELMEISHLILKHHENWDGSGYPLGLKHMEIPLECRILSIVDTYDAMTNDRPYRKALSHEEAIEELIRCRRTQFDPNLVDVFVQLFENEDT